MENVVYERIQLGEIVVIRRKYAGIIYYADLRKSFEYMIDNNLISNEMKIGIVTDLTEAKLKIKISEFMLVLNYLKDHPIYSKAPLAAIVNSPMTTIFPTIAANIISLHVKPFYEFDSAVNWVVQFWDVK